MDIRAGDDPVRPTPLGLGRRGLIPNFYDVIVFILIAGAFAAIAHGAHEMSASLKGLDVAPITLDPRNLPEYALRTTLRMFAAILLSLLFTFVVATLAAKSRKAELVIIPALDILQSVPVLGFLTFTVTFFLGLFPGNEFGAECAAIFAIFTAQAWNMAFSFYQSLRTVPSDLDEVLPALPALALVALLAAGSSVRRPRPDLEHDDVDVGRLVLRRRFGSDHGRRHHRQPSGHRLLDRARDQPQNLGAVAQAVGVMALVILAYDQLLFRRSSPGPTSSSSSRPPPRSGRSSWVYDLVRRTKLLRRILAPSHGSPPRVSTLAHSVTQAATATVTGGPCSRQQCVAWLAIVLAGTAYALWLIISYARAEIGPREVITAVGLGLLTLLRVIILIAIASAIWVPIGVWIGLRPWAAERVQPIAQFLAAFPANVLFPIAVVGIVSLRLDPNIWLSPLMVLGTQWYILFNVIAGASAFPTDLREAATLYRLRSAQWWQKVIMPGILPYYVTGALTATGGSWNASIVAEVASWGDTKLKAAGLGAYIATATEAGDYPRVVLGIAVMSVFVIVVNRLLWRPLYRLAEERYRLD